jgi:hypothetical protein
MNVAANLFALVFGQAGKLALGGGPTGVSAQHRLSGRLAFGHRSSHLLN